MHLRPRELTPVSSGPTSGQPVAAERAGALHRARWSAAVAPLLDADADALWRRHCDAVNASLLRRWLAPVRGERILKTDLWDEAMGEGLQPLLASATQRVTGIDFLPSVLAAAAARYPQLEAVLADVRQLPFADGAFDAIVSTSTLDHFEMLDDVGVALAELHRVLAPGGRLLLTLDNGVNPLVALRNALPFALLQRAGVVPYPVGPTCGPRRLRRMVERVGFEVRETTTLLHCPRALAVASARRVHRGGDAAARQRWLDRQLRWEALARLPTRFLTGYFIGVEARRR